MQNNFNLLLHETEFGGGFSPTVVLKLRRLARKVAHGSSLYVDRTAYSLLVQVLALSFYVPHPQPLQAPLHERCRAHISLRAKAKLSSLIAPRTMQSHSAYVICDL